MEKCSGEIKIEIKVHMIFIQLVAQRIKMY